MNSCPEEVALHKLEAGARKGSDPYSRAMTDPIDGGVAARRGAYQDIRRMSGIRPFVECKPFQESILQLFMQKQAKVISSKTFNDLINPFCNQTEEDDMMNTCPRCGAPVERRVTTLVEIRPDGDYREPLVETHKTKSTYACGTVIREDLHTDRVKKIGGGCA